MRLAPQENICHMFLPLNHTPKDALQHEVRGETLNLLKLVKEDDNPLLPRQTLRQ